jgi:hypothetical protein
MLYKIVYGWPRAVMITSHYTSDNGDGPEGHIPSNPGKGPELSTGGCTQLSRQSQWTVHCVEDPKRPSPLKKEKCERKIFTTGNRVGPCFPATCQNSILEATILLGTLRHQQRCSSPSTSGDADRLAPRPSYVQGSFPLMDPP